MKLIIVSNRAPVKVFRDESGVLDIRAATGGLATGLGSYVDHERKSDSKREVVWIGWPGMAVEEEERPAVDAKLRSEYGVQAVHLSNEIMERFYQGFCNKTLWPLFHYFPSLTEYEQSNWEEYISVNETFAQAILEIAEPDDTIWVHDYHLMLVPSLLRAKLPNASVGFFLHVPFPSYEVFRLLPSQWREHILRGLLGSDLVGFHTPEYKSYFLRSVEQVLSLETEFDEMRYGDRVVLAGAFPMGIEYSRYHEAVLSPEVREESNALREHIGEMKLILSIDRQDYSKGILNRLDGYAYFLESHPEWRGKVTVVMVVVPSRAGVDNYQLVKSQIDEAVGRINGAYTRLGWTPIVYQYRELEFAELIALFASSHIALVTPLRDGMNLVAKEYIATRIEQTGVLILSEMAGAVDELLNAVIINPNYKEEIGNALAQALDMPIEEQRERMTIMQKRVEEYDVLRWATDFLTALESVRLKRQAFGTLALDEVNRKEILDAFASARSRLLLLDYDGTLTPIVSDPATAVPSETLLHTLHALSVMPKTDVAIVSGRDRSTLEEWFGGVLIGLAAEHGVFVRKAPRRWMPEILRRIQSRWKRTPGTSAHWKPTIRSLMQAAADSLPGSRIEEKEYSLAFHYRMSDTELAAEHVPALIIALQSVVPDNKLQILEGKKLVEVRVASVDKGLAARSWLGTKTPPEFILAIGDDTTDEDLFSALPPSAFTIKVGRHPSQAKFCLDSDTDVIELLKQLAGALLTSNDRVRQS